VIDATPFWIADHPRPTNLAGELPRSADVVVVGSGYTGLSAARRLARSGRAVVVLEAGPVAAGASSVNAGMVSADVKGGVEAVARRHGQSLAREVWKATERAVDLVEEIIAAEEIDADWRRTEMAGLGSRPGDAGRLASEANWMRAEMGYPMEVIGPGSIGEVVGSRRFTAALVEPAAALHPARYVFGLAAAVVRAGVTLCEHTPATNIVRDGTGFTVSTGHGAVRAGAVLMATNGYTGDLLPDLRRRVVPVGSYIAVTEPLPFEQAERLIPKNRMLWTYRRLLNYLRRTPDDRLLLGGRQDLRTGLDPARSAADLRRRIVQFFPELAGIRITHGWGGTIGITFDLLPHLGQIDGVWYALGYCGHGVALATYLGDEVGGRIAGEVDRSPFEEIPHPTRWYYRRRPWFLPVAAAGYRILDHWGR
jgi:glycine/D-amino acid oxidase-like deaminating enzyme